jgi:hypothetical protein
MQGRLVVQETQEPLATQQLRELAVQVVLAVD